MGPGVIIANRAKGEKRESGVEGNASCKAGGWVAES
jgi:hypothetical protein